MATETDVQNLARDIAEGSAPIGLACLVTFPDAPTCLVIVCRGYHCRWQHPRNAKMHRLSDRLFAAGLEIDRTRSSVRREGGWAMEVRLPVDQPAEETRQLIVTILKECGFEFAGPHG